MLILFLSGCTNTKFNKQYLDLKKNLLEMQSTEFIETIPDFAVNGKKINYEDELFYYIITFDQPSSRINNLSALAVAESERSKKTDTLFPSIGIMTTKITLVQDNPNREQDEYKGINMTMIEEKDYSFFLIYINYSVLDEEATYYLRLAMNEI